MARILYWNINNFSLGKIHVARPPALANEATDRLDHIVNNIMVGPIGGPIPDIIVVVEVHSRVPDLSVEGTVLSPNRNAGMGVMRLLAEIRRNAVLNAGGANWCVVPPLNLGAFGLREAVAVFYNATTLQFTGPNIFWQLYEYSDGAKVGQSQPVNAATAGAATPYPAAWLGALPALGRTTAFPGGATIAENQLAGEWQYYPPGVVQPVPSPIPPERGAGRLSFPNVDSRGPFYTRFQEVAGLGRTINVFTVHTSPSTAWQAILQMGRIPQMNIAAPANTVNVIVGDFNVDTFGGTWGAYDWMLPPLGNYVAALDPRDATGIVNPARKPYCMTHLLPVISATPYNKEGVVAADPQHNVYPRFGYMGSIFPAIKDSGAIDNFFTSYGPGAGVPAANITVANTLTGTPYNLFPPAAAGVTHELTGGLGYNSSIAGPNVLITVPPANLGTGGITVGAPLAGFYSMTFQIWNRYGKIYSTSDHLPLLLDV